MKPRVPRKKSGGGPGFLGRHAAFDSLRFGIRRHYPEAGLHVLSAPLARKYCDWRHVWICVWPLELDPARRAPCANIGGVIRALRRTFDVSFNFGGNRRTTDSRRLDRRSPARGACGGARTFLDRWLSCELGAAPGPGFDCV